MLDESAEVTSGPTPAALPEFDMSQYEYTLVGVVVHSGSADCGHYYSFIKIRGCDEGKSSSTSSWYEFNDTIVTKFDEKDKIVQLKCHKNHVKFSYLFSVDSIFTESITKYILKRK